MSCRNLLRLVLTLCLAMPQSGVHSSPNSTCIHDDFQAQAEHIVGKIFDYSNNQTHYLEAESRLSAMESRELRRLCFCVHSEPLCEVQVVPLTVSPGESVTLSLVALDQHNHSVSTILYTRFTVDTNQNQQFLNSKLHSVQPNCQNITFKVSSKNFRESVSLSSYPISLSLNTLSLNLTFLPCPKGFVLLPSSHKCQCSEYFQWIDGVKCSSENHMVERKRNSWLEYSCSGAKQTQCGLKYHDNCPYHYCNQSIEHVDLSVSNSVCTGNRAGTLCGGCAENYSTIIGGSDCWDCRNVSTTRTKILILWFVVAGMLLVAVTIFLDLRISGGRLNGFIFYCAVLNLNQDAFFRANSTIGKILSLLFSWLNLDLGFSVCSFNGLKPVTKHWFQFAFPAYIVLLIFIVLFAFQFSRTLSNLSAIAFPSSITLLLLAYLKILKTATSTLPFTRVQMQPHGSETMVWLYDGNVGYLDSEHIKLFIVSVLFLIFVAIPYTYFLLFSQFLFQLDLLDAKFGLNLSIILDAYVGRTKPISRFWFGLLLLFYTFQVTVYHCTGGDTVVNLVVAIMCACLLLSINLILDGPYKDTFTNKLEQFFFMNIIAISSLHIYFQDRQSSLPICSDLLVMSAGLIILLFSILEHCLKYSQFQFLKRFWELHGKQTPSVTPPDTPTDLESNHSWGNYSMSSYDFRTDLEEDIIIDSSTETEKTQTIQDKTRQGSPKKTITSSFLYIGNDGEASLMSDVGEQNVKSHSSSLKNTKNTMLNPTSIMQTRAVTPPRLERAHKDQVLVSKISPRKLMTKKGRTHSQIFGKKYTTQSRKRVKYFSSFPQSLSVLATCLPGHFPISVFEVNSNGRKFSYQGIVVDIPPGAICNQGCEVKIEIGILAHGPFQCCSQTTRVSPVLWFCCTDYVRFEKSIQITLPHCLRRVSTVGNESLGMCFMRANCLFDISGSVVNFRSLDQTESVIFTENKGTLQTKLAAQGCFFCIAANQAPSLFVKKAEYCLTRIDPKPWIQDTTVYFCVSYFLKTCFEDIQKQFPSERFEIKSRTCFQFHSDCKNPKIGIDVASCNGWLLAVEHPGSKEIFASEVHFSHENDTAYKLKTEYGIYPPRFQLRVCGAHAYAPTTAHVSFTGIVPRVDAHLLLTSDTPPRPAFLGGAYNMPCDMEMPRNADFDHTGTAIGIINSKRWVSLPPGSRGRVTSSDYSDKFITTVSSLEENEGLGYLISWPRLQDYVTQMAPRWKQIGTYLILQFQLEIIEHNFRNSSCEDKVAAVLRVWEKSTGQGLEFYWSVLIAVLQCVEERDLALDLIRDNSRAPAYQ